MKKIFTVMLALTFITACGTPNNNDDNINDQTPANNAPTNDNIDQNKDNNMDQNKDNNMNDNDTNLNREQMNEDNNLDPNNDQNDDILNNDNNNK